MGDYERLLRDYYKGIAIGFFAGGLTIGAALLAFILKALGR